MRMAAFWRNWFFSLGIKGLLRDARRPSRTPSIPASTVEFSVTDRQEIRRGVCRDLERLITAIGDYIDKHNAHPEAVHLDCKGQRHPGTVARAQAAPNNRPFV